MQNIKTFLSDLRRAAWRTSGARYNAARRLRRREWFATFSIAMFSVAGILLAVYQRIYAIPAGGVLDNYLTIVSMFLGLFVLVISLIESGASNAVRAELLHRNAEELNEFQRKAAQVLAFAVDREKLEDRMVEDLRAEYEELKRRCPYNHEPRDATLFDAQQRLSPELARADGNPRIGCLRAKWIELDSYVQPVRYFLGLWLLLGVVLWLTPWRT